MITITSYHFTALFCLALFAVLSLILVGCSDSGAESDQSENTPVVSTDQEESAPAVSTTQAESAPTAITWITDYQKGMNLAQQQNKPALIIFTTTWCPPCLMMKEKVYPDPKVVQAVQAFIPIMIDPDYEKELTQKFNVTGIPAFFILGPDGKQIVSFVGYHEPDDFIAKLKSVL